MSTRYTMITMSMRDNIQYARKTVEGQKRMQVTHGRCFSSEFRTTMKDFSLSIWSQSIGCYVQKKLWVTTRWNFSYKQDGAMIAGRKRNGCITGRFDGMFQIMDQNDCPVLESRDDHYMLDHETSVDPTNNSLRDGA